MPEIHLKQHGFTYDACGLFTKNKKRIEKFMRIGNTDYIYKNDLDKAGSEHYLVYGKYKGLSKRTNQIKFWKIEIEISKLLKLQVIQNIMVIKED